MRLESEKSKLLGITLNTSTCEYMIVFEELHNRNSYNGLCLHCNRYNTSPAWCQTCDPPRTTQGWTSGNKDIDDYFKRLQLGTIKYEETIVWIPFDRLNIARNINEVELLAIWLDGIRTVSNFTQSRIPSYSVTLKIFTVSQMSSDDFLKEFKNYVQLKRNEIKMYGITQNNITNEFMIIFETYDNKYAFKRNSNYGNCTDCNRFNTSKSWCQSCDPLKVAKGWTSGNNDIDSCIKESQFEASEYEKVIEWIPFDRLDDVQEIA
ncbi:hypothetical protein C2G38_615737 [Gigaspora rosea]|uniref:Uncharacterized protein n=1 Tax=Gigaspora rosea TaxID=44941 RepID=A0A397VUV8_9GLOM|nr:hypothetical protein C2G38_615737 [Gigaspora rosea]